MADFELAHAATMKAEGGFANNPADKGGMTYKGIARVFHGKWHGWRYIDSVLARLVNQPTYNTKEYFNWVRHLNGELQASPALQQLVLEFYKASFWSANRLGEIASQAVAEWVYDHIVNAGARGAQWAQEAAGVKADGSIGPVTIAAINAMDPAAFLREAEDVAAFYRLDRALQTSTQIQFLPSWLRRDGVSETEIREVMAMAKDGLTHDEVKKLKGMIEATA